VGVRLGGALAALLMLVGCVQSTLPTPEPSVSSMGQAGSSCAGLQAASTYVLNDNATPPLDIYGAKVSASGIATDSVGPRADITVVDGDAHVTFQAKRVGDTISVSGTPMKVTHICVVDMLPSPLPPGTSRGTVGLANA